MTALHDLHPDSDHPVLSGLAVIEETLDRILGGVAVPLASGDYAGVIRRIERTTRRLDSVKLKIVAAADRAGTAQQAGFTGTDAWVAKNTTTSRASAAKEVGLARDLTSSSHDTTAQALDQGLVSPEHAAVILNAGRQLPAGVTDEQRRAVETSLVQKARRFDPEQLRRAARRAVEAIEPDEKVVDASENEQLRSEEENARDKCKLSMRDNGDGTTTGHFTVPTLAAAVLKKIIESMTAPRRMRETRTPHGDNTPEGSARPGAGPGAAGPSGAGPTRTGPTGTASTGTASTGTASTGAASEGRATADSGTPGPRDYDWSHRRGLALTELLEHLPTDHLHHKTAATVDHDTLTGALKAAHLDTGHQITAGEARRLACTAGILPAVLAGTSLTLDLGRENRLFSQTQRIAVGLRHDTCAADGCERPTAWCELHHLKPWATGGRTDLANAIPLCGWHHQRIHDHTFTHQPLPDGTLRFSRRT